MDRPNNSADSRGNRSGAAGAPQAARPNGGVAPHVAAPHAGHPGSATAPRTAAPRPTGRVATSELPANPRAAAHEAHVGSGSTINRDDLVRVRHKHKKRHRTAKRVALVVAAVLVALLAVAAAVGVWYTSTIAGNLAMDDQSKQELEGALAGDSAINQEPFYMLVIGSDKWEDYGERADAMMLVRVDPVDHVVTMVSVPRDTPYYLDGCKVKMNEVFAQQGPAGAVTAVQELTGADISYYVEVEFGGLEDFIDAIGGIYVDVPYTIDYTVYTKDRPTVHIEAGEQLLTGNEAVALARMRSDYAEQVWQDAVRQSNVRAMVVAMINTILESTPVEIPGMVEELSRCVSTNLEVSQLVDLATNFVSAGGTTIYTCTGPYEGAIDEETKLWLCYEDPEGWAELMAKVDAGENPETSENQVEGK